MEDQASSNLYSLTANWLLKQGWQTVLLVGISIFFGYKVVVPMQDDQKRYVDALIKTQERYVASFEQLVSSHKDATDQLRGIRTGQETANVKLDGILETQKQLVPTLQQIRDDQRKFPAISEKAHN